MEHCFRTALCIFVLLGCLQAAPTTSTKAAPAIKMSDFHFDKLTVTCNENITFRCPKNESGSIIKQTIDKELEKAQMFCRCKRCGKALDAFSHFKVPSVLSNTLVCTRGTAGSLTFNQFVEELKEVVEFINTNLKS